MQKTLTGAKDAARGALDSHPETDHEPEPAATRSLLSNRPWADMIELVEPGLRSPAPSAIS